MNPVEDLKSLEKEYITYRRNAMYQCGNDNLSEMNVLNTFAINVAREIKKHCERYDLKPTIYISD